jgi:D-alanyl-D-alanine carboxypeptidase/D-alanyl-D-alanine-endopeptidase (penicillin-binding protein 4)
VARTARRHHVSAGGTLTPGGRRRRGPGGLLLAVALLGALLAGGVYVALGRGRRTPARARSAHGLARQPRAKAAPRTPGPAPLASPTPSAALSSLQRSLRAGLQALGPSSGAAVLDLTDGQLLFDVRGATGRPPASVEKLYTSVAALRLLGPESRASTTVLGAGHLGPGGVWHGNLYLRGGGDPTFGDGLFNRIYLRGYGPTATELARQLAARGIRRVTGELFGDGSLFSDELGGMLTGLRPDIPDFGGELGALVYDHGEVARVGGSPAVFAARELAATLRATGVEVRAAKRAEPTPAGAQPLGLVRSPPLRALLSLMNVPSDDLIAEMLDEQLGVRFGAGGTIQQGAQVISRLIAQDYGLRPTILDGSGLDRADRSSPLQVVEFLRELWGTPTGELLYASLPVLGRSGTVRGIALKTAAVGRCAAKTGTLTGVSNLAGYCHARDGHELAFAIMADGPPNWTAFVQIGRMVAAIARY